MSSKANDGDDRATCILDIVVRQFIQIEIDLSEKEAHTKGCEKFQALISRAASPPNSFFVPCSTLQANNVEGSHENVASFFNFTLSEHEENEPATAAAEKDGHVKLSESAFM